MGKGAHLVDEPRNRELIGVLLLTTSFIIGCATISPEEFQGYSADERARVICNESKRARQRRYEIRNIRTRVETQSELLVTGYRVHKHCQTIKEKTEGNCGDAADEDSSCVRPIEVKREVCSETPVTIDPYYEETVLDNLKARLGNLESSNSKLFKVCAEKAKPLGFQEAYYLYDRGLEP